MNIKAKYLVSEITNFSTKDGPGIRTTVFLKGCPLRCRWCSNPETFTAERMLMFISNRCVKCGNCVSVCPKDAIDLKQGHLRRIDRKKCIKCMDCVNICLHDAYKISGEYYTSDELMKVISRDKIFYGKEGGVTISGGEPLMNGEFVLEIFKRCQEEGIGTVLDTTGYGDTELLCKILKYTDMVLLDLKQMDPKKHKQWTGISNELILKNAEIIMENVDTRISIPLIPGVNSDKSNMIKTAAFAAKHGAKAVDINPLHTLGAGKYHFLGKQSPYGKFGELTQDEITTAVRVFKEYGYGKYWKNDVINSIYFK